MTKLYDGILVFTFDEWKNNPDVQQLLSETSEDCPTCDGSREHECECGDTHNCGACDGRGTSEDYREVYEQQLRDEIKRLKNWIDKFGSKSEV